MKKNLFRGLTAAACAAVAGLFAGNPAATTPVNPVNEGIQQAPTNYKNNAQRQMAQNNINQVRQHIAQNYTVGGGGMGYGPGSWGMSPKEYGEYLMRSGRDKYNDRKRKHIAKGVSKA